MKYVVLALALTLAASVAFADEPPSYPVDVEDGGPAVQGSITYVPSSSETANQLPQTVSAAHMAELVTRHIPYADGTLDYYYNDQAPSFDPVVSAHTGRRTIGVAAFADCDGRPCAVPYVYCPDHGVYELTALVYGATLKNDAAVAAQLTSDFRARVHARDLSVPSPAASGPSPPAPGVVETVPAVYQVPPNPRAAASASVVTPSTPEEVKENSSLAQAALRWLGGLVLLLVVWQIVAKVLEHVADNARPIRIEAADHNRAVQAFQDRLGRDYNHLRSLNAAVDEEERYFINRITEIQKGA